jgi:hypothetical protein
MRLPSGPIKRNFRFENVLGSKDWLKALAASNKKSKEQS